ncbi:MAG: host attachment protein [Betaproteobacteria bacterium]
MKKTCLIVADRARARLFLVLPEEGTRRKLRLDEQATLNAETRGRGAGGDARARSERHSNRDAGPVHPVAAQRERHRLEHERRFGAEIVRRAVGVTANWEDGVMLLIAEPRLLGLVREPLREALKPAIRLEELAKDYAGLSTTELERVVVAQRLAR